MITFDFYKKVWIVLPLRIFLIDIQTLLHEVMRMRAMRPIGDPKKLRRVILKELE